MSGGDERASGWDGGSAHAAQADAASCPATGCITCSDEAVAVTVRELLEAGLALVEVGGHLEEVSVALVDAGVGDVVLVHAKEAIAVVNQPGVSQPGVSQPGVSQPGVSQPGVSQPVVNQPVVNQPGVNQSP